MNDSPDNNEVPLLEHDSDGIQELDNLLPRWWVWLFWLTTFFSVGYMLYFHVFNFAPLQIGEYEIEARAGEQLKGAALAEFESTLDSLEPSQDPAILATGGQVYSTYCAPCHRPDGGGLVGPNLTDSYWIHGDTYHQNLKTIINGAPEKGMLSWRGILKPQEIQAVASFIFTLRGTQPPNPKPPENQAPVQTGPSEFE